MKTADQGENAARQQVGLAAAIPAAEKKSRKGRQQGVRHSIVYVIVRAQMQHPAWGSGTSVRTMLCCCHGGTCCACAAVRTRVVCSAPARAGLVHGIGGYGCVVRSFECFPSQVLRACTTNMPCAQVRFPSFDSI